MYRIKKMNETKLSNAKRPKSFVDNWLQEDEFKQWLKEIDGDNMKFSCTICKKTLSLSSSGRGAVADHAETSNHKDLLKKTSHLLHSEKS